MEALCSLDAARFRLPLITAVRRLLERVPPGILMLDAPGVVRGVAGAELLTSLAESARIDAVLVLLRDGASMPFEEELRALPADVFAIRAAPAAHRPNKRERGRWRTKLWDQYLVDAKEQMFELSDVQLLGTPPPLAEVNAWKGRQIAALSKQGATLALGELIEKDNDALRVKMPQLCDTVFALAVRDAQRTEDGWIGTAPRPVRNTLWYTGPSDLMASPGVGGKGGPRPVVHVGSAIATLINGVFGDPLLHVRMRHRRRSFLFDLGETRRLSARIAHQVTDVCVSHAHIDHIAGFLWLLRSRIGEFSACRLFGPPGLAQNIQGFVCGIHWDRIGDRGPKFEVIELHEGRLLHFRIQAGRYPMEQLGDTKVVDGVLFREPEVEVRAVILDHGTPVLGFSFEQPSRLNVRKQGLAALGVPPGPWLGELKKCLANNDHQAAIHLPDGRTESAGALANELISIAPRQKLVYATDLIDSMENRQRLVAFAQGAHVFFCEAAFVESDRALAMRSGHLTARACGEIATAAGVDHLVPFHFSRRYDKDPTRVYEEVRVSCPRIVCGVRSPAVEQKA
jgi:ribonuclease BN (tRNA processing enzyme)